MVQEVSDNIISSSETSERWLLTQRTEISGILGSDAGYGSYSVLGNLTVDLGLEASSTSDYKLWLDIDRGVGGSQFTTEKYGKITR